MPTEPSPELLTQMQPFLRRHLVGAHGYDDRALVGMDGSQLHHVHVSQPTGHCHHDREHRACMDPLTGLIELRDSLPRDHHERPGVVRSIEVLRSYGYDVLDADSNLP